ncbi:hypothetical protein QJT91_11905, partial [Bordetella bronchiseptica]
YQRDADQWVHVAPASFTAAEAPSLEPGAPPPVRFDVVAFEAGRPHWLRGAFWLAEHAPAQGRRGQDAQGWRVR